jgi:hypothetical protein
LAGVVAGRSRRFRDIAKIQRDFVRHLELAAGGINVLRKRLADHSRLFANFLENELPTLALLGATVREGGSATVAY